MSALFNKKSGVRTYKGVQDKMLSLMRWATQPVPTNECECEQGCQGFMLMLNCEGGATS